jgi:hypothetical protein
MANQINKDEDKKKKKTKELKQHCLMKWEEPNK